MNGKIAKELRAMYTEVMCGGGTKPTVAYVKTKTGFINPYREAKRKFTHSGGGEKGLLAARNYLINTIYRNKAENALLDSELKMKSIIEEIEKLRDEAYEKVSAPLMRYRKKNKPKPKK